MAVGQDAGTESASRNGTSVPLADLLQRSMAGRSLQRIPGLPIRPWVMWLTVSSAVLCTLLASWLLAAHDSLPRLLDPITRRLFVPQDPAFAVVLESFGWMAAGQLCLLVGWCRSRSSLDFKGRYRLWYWVGAVSLAVGVCRLLDLHVAMAEILLEFTQWRFWNAANVLWTGTSLVVAMLLVRSLDRDMRSSPISLWSLRFSAVLMMACLCVRLALDRSASLTGSANASAETSLAILRLWTAAAVAVTSWLHLRHVVYITADPPASTERRANRITRVLAGMRLFRWWGVKRPVPPAKPTRGRRKAAASSEDAPKKPTRKKATRKKTTRAKPIAADYDSTSAEEEAAEEAYEYEEESDAGEQQSSDEPLDRDAEIQRAMDEEDWDRLEELTRPDNGSNSPPVNNKSAKAGNTSKAKHQPVVEEASYDSPSEDDSDQEYQRVDEGHQQLKGLSKRQRRDMKKKQKSGGYGEEDE